MGWIATPAYRSLCGTRLLQSRGYLLLVGRCHLRIERQDDAVILRRFGMRQRNAQRLARIDCLTVAAHDATARRNPGIEHDLHHCALVTMVGQPHAIALPIAPCIRWL